MVSGQILSDLPDDIRDKVEKIIEKAGGVLGPGCCEFNAAFGSGGALYRISNCGDRATCDQIVAGFRGTFLNYTQGKDCS